MKYRILIRLPELRDVFSFEPALPTHLLSYFCLFLFGCLEFGDYCWMFCFVLPQWTYLWYFRDFFLFACHPIYYLFFKEHLMMFKRTSLSVIVLPFLWIVALLPQFAWHAAQSDVLFCINESLPSPNQIKSALRTRTIVFYLFFSSHDLV